MWTLRKTVSRQRKINRIAAALGEDPRNISAVLDYCINNTIINMPQIPPEWRPEKRERNEAHQRVISEIVDELTNQTWAGEPPTPAERLDIYSEHFAPIPVWIDSIDRQEIIETVTYNLEQQEKA